ncbi:hypothetical protein CBS101457_001870 [Exobasidium rhododendri]|nr:hypothetical protein CBS101457_001870 [Exobasidium rhododendri]
MGVQGLWHLLQPCARPTKLESLEGRRLAIDSSIWLYHFQMAMRDKEGRTLSNAHILGFLWRILKLIHYGIRPIFVFDGGAPVMKRQTLVGRRQRKSGAKDDHRRIAEKLLNARLREAAISHVANGNSGPQASTEKEASNEESDSHGLGQNTVYFDDLAGPTNASSIPAQHTHNGSEWMDIADGGAISPNKGVLGEEDSEAQKKKKRNDWHKDPYALPALERDINTLTANNSSAAKAARGGGKRQDVRFATEGELRALLSSIGPTDLDLDSEFFRSLPSELQYELVGDMRAASRGTSYKRLQSMLSQSPTPIDFSRAQIAGLKTRNELTQKAFQVTDEIGDAHIKVPIRVAGARNREYVLVRNKGDQGGFALGVRESGTTQEKAIAVDEDTASATSDEDFEPKNTDEEVELEEVAMDASTFPSKEKQAFHEELRKANPNDPAARKEVAKELLQRRAKALIREKAKYQGRSFEAEEMEEQLQKAKEHKRLSNKSRKVVSGSAKASLFRSRKQRKDESIVVESEGTDLEEDDYDDEEDDVETKDEEEEDWEELLNQHEAADLARALDESEEATAHSKTDGKEEDEDEDLEEMEMEEVLGHAFDAGDYSAFYVPDQATPTSTEVAKKDHETPTWMTQCPAAERGATPSSISKSSYMASPTPRSSKKDPIRASFLQDQENTPQESIDQRLVMKRPWERAQYSAQEIAANMTKKVGGDDRVLPNDSPSQPTPSPPSPASRVISISDSEASQDDKTEGVVNLSLPKRSMAPETSTVTMRVERDNLERQGGSEIKVVDFQDREIDKSEDSNRGRQRAVPLSSSAGGSSPIALPSSPPSPIEITDDTVSVSSGETHRPSPILESNTTLAEEEKPSRSTSVDAEPQEESYSMSSPLGEARRAEERPPSSPILALEEELEQETGEKVSYDNMGSMMDETGDYPLIDSEAIVEEAEKEDNRLSEDEHSDYSNQGFGKDDDDSDSEIEQREVVLGPDGFPLPTAEEFAAMEAEDEADLGEMNNDQDEFVSFLSRAKGQGLNQIRKEVEDEVNKLRSEHATTRRTEGEVTQQMAKEIQFMLRMFGLPYITAPMEAEAQCAELIALKLADGIITDDSDVFLFGGTFIYKNMFNNKKYVECYKLSDLQHDLGMDRTKLVQLAYLLGSDYTEGLEGVGPVLAMEILSLFPGDDGLVKFREWWLKVQTGKDTVRDTYNSTLKRLKRTLRNKVHLESHWPDPNVIDAYFEPTVDDSKESFQWGLPDLDSLRSFFGEYLRWDKEKTDHYLIPAIEAQNRRSRRQGMQSTLDRGNFFDLGAGEGVYAGRKRTGYGSSRLQEVIKNFRASNSGKEGRGKDGHEGEEREEGGKEGGEIDLVSLSEDEADGEEHVSEEMLGKEMGKRSRPVVRRKKPEQPTSTEMKESQDQRSKSNEKSGKAKGRKRKASTGKDHDTVHDQEWRPVKAKRKGGKAREAAKAAGGTTLSQARNMSLDSLDSLPKSRAETNSKRVQEGRTPRAYVPIRNGGDDSSGLSELD